MGGLVRCVACGEVQWSLKLGARQPSEPVCRLCGEPVRVERRRPGRRFGMRIVEERRDVRPPVSG